MCEPGKHDAYWKRIGSEAGARIDRMFAESGLDLAELLGDDDGIDSYGDAKKALAYILCHAETNNEKACGILSACEWLQACHELHEHDDAR